MPLPSTKLITAEGPSIALMQPSSLRARARMVKAKMAKAKVKMARERAKEKARKERHPPSPLPRAQAQWLSLPEQRSPSQIPMTSDGTPSLLQLVFASPAQQ